MRFVHCYSQHINLKRLHFRIFQLCCAAVGLRTDGTNPGRDLSLKLQQRLTRWGPLCDCKAMLDMIPRFDSFRGSGTLLELASLHNICLDENTSENDGLRDAIVRHLVSGQCQGSIAPLCTSVCSELLSLNHSSPSSLMPLVLDVFIRHTTKKTLQRALRCSRITNSTEPVDVLRTLLRQHHDTFLQPLSARDSTSKAKISSDTTSAFRSVSDVWPQQISHSDKS